MNIYIFLESVHGLNQGFQDTFVKVYLRSHEKCRNQAILMDADVCYNI